MIPRKNPRRSRGAAAANVHGNAFAAWLDAQHEAALLAGLACVRRVGPPVVVGASGKPVAWAGDGPADYQGTLRGGRSVAVEAKSRESRLSRREIPQHQIDDLDRVASLGGLALLLVEIRAASLIAAVPWASVPWHESTRRVKRGCLVRVERSHSVGAEELAPWRVPTRSVYLARWVTL